MLVDMAGSENIEQAGQNGLEAKMQRLNPNNVIRLQNRIPQIESRGLSGTIDGDSQARVLTKGSREGDIEDVAVELDGGGERRREFEDREEREERTHQSQPPKQS